MQVNLARDPGKFIPFPRSPGKEWFPYVSEYSDDGEPLRWEKKELGTNAIITGERIKGGSTVVVNVSLRNTEMTGVKK